MSDLLQLLDKVQTPETSHTDMVSRVAKGTQQWFLENDHKTHPIYNRNALEFMVCGAEGFARIDADIRAANTSIDLVCWGFDPGMELVRKPGASRWPRGETYGDLLNAKGRQGVQVRMLLWYDEDFINSLSGNTPDMPMWWKPLPKMPQEFCAPSHALLESRGVSRIELEKIRADYCRNWWKLALGGAFTNLEVRARKADIGMISRNIDKHLPHRHSLIEEMTRRLVATHHQKPILIDYQPAKNADLRSRPNTCGYVMGLNSVTDYWDSDQHVFNNPLREVNWQAGASWTNAWHRKPYRDYAIRVQGEALYSLNENFVQGWDAAHPVGRIQLGIVSSGIDAVSLAVTGGLAGERQSVQPKNLPAPAGANQRVQIVRTQPEKLDATILKAYTLATSNAINYIYIENQYFQLTEWPQFLKTVRRQYCSAMKKAGKGPGDIDPLHLFVVIPQPERSEMVPRTYETVGQLGQAGRMSGYDGQVQGQRKIQKQEEDGKSNAIMADSGATVPVDAKEQLDALGIQPLVAMLMSYDMANESKNIRLNKRDNDAQEKQAAREIGDAKKAGKPVHASDEDTANFSDTNIVPRRYREIYIHSKLMLVDDVYTTLGSANLNARSMLSDSELNICTANHAFTRGVRQRVWGNLAGSDLDGKSGGRKETKDTFEGWFDRMYVNRKTRFGDGGIPKEGSFIHPFEDPRVAPLVRFD